MVCYISPTETLTAALSKKGSISQVFKRNFMFFIAFCKVHLIRDFGFKDDLEGFVQYPLRISTVDYHGGRIAFHFS